MHVINIFTIIELYLLGLDLAIDSVSGSTHSKQHHFNEQLNINSSNKHHDIQEFSKTVIKTVGNFSKDVYTTPVFMLSIKSINDLSLYFKKEYQNVVCLYNLFKENR